MNFKAAVIAARITRLYRGRNWKYLNKNDGKYFVSLLLLHWYVSRLREKNVCYETILVRIHITFSQRFHNQYHKTHSCQRFYKRSDFASLIPLANYDGGNRVQYYILHLHLRLKYILVFMLKYYFKISLRNKSWWRCITYQR